MDRYEYSTHLLSYWVREKQIMSLGPLYQAATA